MKIYKFFLLSFCTYVQAQQSLPFDQQYLLSDMVLINPSYTGATDDFVLKGTYHQQWQKFDQSPNTQTISAHVNAFDRVGLGAYFFRDENGPATINGLNVSAAYHIPLSYMERTKNQFSFGASLSYFAQTFDYSKLRPEHPDDPILYGTKSVYMPYLNLGMSLAYSGFSAAVSVLDISLNGNIRPVINSIEPAPTRYYLNLGYNWEVADQLYLEPSFMMSLNTNSERLIDLNIKGIYKDDMDDSFAVGVSYRMAKDAQISGGLSFTPFFQAQLTKFNFTFGYNFGITDVYKEGGDGLLFGIGYNLDNFLNFNGFRYR